MANTNDKFSFCRTSVWCMCLYIIMCVYTVHISEKKTIFNSDSRFCSIVWSRHTSTAFFHVEFLFTHWHIQSFSGNACYGPGKCCDAPTNLTNFLNVRILVLLILGGWLTQFNIVRFLKFFWKLFLLDGKLIPIIACW